MCFKYTRSKCILENLNVIFMALNANLLMCGIILLAGHDALQLLSIELQESFVENAESMGVTFTTVTLGIDHIMKPFAVTITALAIIALSICLVGYVAYSYTKMIAIVVHFCLMLAFLGMLLYFRAQAQDDVDNVESIVLPGVKESFANFGGLEAKDTETVTWNAVMSYHNCCGIRGYADFEGIPVWPPDTINDIVVDLETPLMCCKNKSLNYDCAVKGTANETNNWWEVGCYERIYDQLLNNVIFLIALILYFLLIVLILIMTLITFCLRMTEVPPPPPPPSAKPPSPSALPKVKSDTPTPPESMISAAPSFSQDSMPVEEDESDSSSNEFVTSFY